MRNPGTDSLRIKNTGCLSYILFHRARALSHRRTPDGVLPASMSSIEQASARIPGNRKLQSLLCTPTFTHSTWVPKESCVRKGWRLQASLLRSCKPPPPARGGAGGFLFCTHAEPFEPMTALFYNIAVSWLTLLHLFFGVWCYKLGM